MNVEPAVFGSVDKTGRDEQAERDGDDQVDGLAAGLGHLSAVRGRASSGLRVQ